MKINTEILIQVQAFVGKNIHNLEEIEKALLLTYHLQGPYVWLKEMIVNFIFQKRSKDRKVDFRFGLIKKIFTNTASRDYLVVESLYKNEPAIFKVATINNSFRLGLLLREVVISKIVNQMISNGFKKEYEISIPKVLGTIYDETTFAVIFEKVEGKSSRNLANSKKIDLYTTLIEFSQSLNSSNNNQYLHLKGWQKMSKKYLISTLIFYFLKNVQKDFINLKMYLKAFIFVISKMFTDERFCLVHRDLYGDNLLIDEKTKRVFIIDWQLALLAPEKCEISNIIASSHDDLVVKEKLLENYHHSNHMIVYFLLQKLTGNYYSSNERNDTKKLLNKIIEK